VSTWSLVLAFAVTSVVAALLLARRLFIVVQVTGTSMSPALMPGDQVLVRRGARRELRAGRIVVFVGPRDERLLWEGSQRAARHWWMIKRVAAADGDAVPDAARAAVGGTAKVPPGMLVVLGDGARSSDSRTWGFLPVADVAGVVVRRLPPVRAGRYGIPPTSLL